MKIAVIGGGSSYTPELVQGFLDRSANLPLTELWLVDIDAGRLAVVGGFAQRMATAAGAPFRVVSTTDRRQGIAGASYVLTQLRVGGMEARREDEYLGRRHGLIGQETTGVGGIAKALRTIPVLLDIAGDMAVLAPGALLINFTNPAGLVTEALHRYAPEVPAVGVCNVAITAKMHILQLLERVTGQTIAASRARLLTLGLNHLTWHRGFTVDSEDVWPKVLTAALDEAAAAPHPQWEGRMIVALQMLPNYYLEYYYDTERMLALQEQWPPSRAEEVMAVERELLAQYAEAGRTQPPPGLMKRGGAWYSTLATQLIHAHCNDLDETHIVNVPHRGAVPGWPPDWVLEMPAAISRTGITPLPAEPLPSVCYDLIAQVKAFELLAVQAAVHGDRRAAYQALLAHPLGPRPDQVQAVLDDLLATNRTFLPQFG